MAKRKKSPPPTSSSSEQATQQANESSNAASPAANQLPSPRAQFFVSLAIVFHFGALLAAFSANLAPSYLQGQITSWLSAYAVTTNQAYSSVPLELTHAEPFDFPLLVEFLPANNQGSEPVEVWERMLLPGSSSANELHDLRWSRWPNLCRVIQLIAADQPDSEILSDIAARLVEMAEKRSDKPFGSIRLIAPRVLSYDEDASVNSGESTLEDDTLAPTIVYRATIVRDSTQQISLIPEQNPLRTAKPVAGQPERP
jgi:hypothetical protein